MALRATALWRSKLTQIGHRSFATASNSKSSNLYVKADYVPIYMIWGFVMAAVGMATHTAKQQLFHSPPVSMNKKRRESVPEVENPESASISGNKFVSKSFLRKVAHIQDDKNATVPSNK